MAGGGRVCDDIQGDHIQGDGQTEQRSSERATAGAQQTMGLACHDAPGAPQRTSIYKATGRGTPQGEASCYGRRARWPCGWCGGLRWPGGCDWPAVAGRVSEEEEDDDDDDDLRPQKYGGGHLPTYGKCLRPRRKETLTGIYLLAEMATRKKRKANDDNNTSTPAEIWRRASTYLRGMTTPEEEGDADGHLPNWKWQRTRCYLVLVVVVVVAVVGSSNNDQTMLCPFLIYPIPHISLEFG